jgi:hypothetical protein
MFSLLRLEVLKVRISLFQFSLHFETDKCFDGLVLSVPNIVTWYGVVRVVGW